MTQKYGVPLKRNSSPEERSAYYKARVEMLKKDPAWVEKQKKRHAEYRSKNRARLAETSRQWNKENPDGKRKIGERYFNKHRDRLNAGQREKNKDPKRKAFMREYLPKHRAENRDMYRTYAHNRKQRTRGTHTVAEWRAKMAQHNNCCVYCGSPDNITRDHDIPVSRGGANTIDNIVPACAPCNYSKKAMTGAEFLASKRRAA